MTEEKVEPTVIADEMIKYLLDEYPVDEFKYKMIEDGKYIIAKITAQRDGAYDELEKEGFDKKFDRLAEKQEIIFLQLIDDSFTSEENYARVKGSYERNIRAADKLGEELLKKHGQIIVRMNQAEIESIKTVKTIIKEDKKK